MSESESEKKVSPTAKKRKGNIKAGLEKAGKNLKAGMEESVGKSRKAIQKRPLTAVAVAAGAATVAGVAAGVLLSKKKKDTKKD